MAANRPFYPGETVVITGTSRNTAGTLVNVTTATITITDPHNSTKVTDSTMTNASTGTYEYAYTLPSRGIRGRWKAVLTFTSGGRVSKEAAFFDVDRI